MERKTVFITGSNRGIGKAILEKFAEEEYNIVACARKDAGGGFLEGLQKKHGIEIHKAIFDMTDSSAMKSEILRLKKVCK